VLAGEEDEVAGVREVLLDGWMGLGGVNEE
jgi:hypothetical protein